jgi:transketolase
MSQRVFAICSDGDLMEGISSEAASIAGHWRLDNLVWLYDDNRITIDGSTDLSFSEDVARRFEGMGWKVLASDGHDRSALREALDTAVAHEGQPVLIICRTHIGYGSPNKVDSSASHGAPLGNDELALTRAQLDWSHAPFEVPTDVQSWFATAQAEKSGSRAEWETRFSAWRTRNPEAADTYDRLWNPESADSLWETLAAAAPGAGATRKISAAVIQKAAEMVPSLVGGSADLSGSNGVVIKGAGVIGAPSYEGQDFSFGGRQFYFGVREHAMGSITNGLLLHGGLRPFSGTFLVFSDYMRPAIRLAALCNLPNIFVFTHDSIFLGEDGPTHQPVEHHWALRTIPGLNYFRPADGLETAMAWAWAIKEQSAPTAFGLTRQGVPEIQRRDDFDPREIWRGGYAVNNVDDPDVILVGTGSELHLCTGAAEALAAYGKRARVVSMPCYDLFAAQDAQYRHAILPPGHPAVVTVEAGITQPWQALTGTDGLNIGIDRFGASAPASVLAEQFGFTVDAITRKVRALFASQA